MKVNIGSKYIGPALDRPCLRTLPTGWVLEESKPIRRPFMTPDRWVAVAVLLGWMFVAAQAVGLVK